MTKQDLVDNIRKKKSYLCVGLDTDITKIPVHLQNSPDPIFEFNRRIIDATAEYCVAYKPNTAFYEAMGSKGWESLAKTIEYIPKDIFTIADAKRGDIGNTGKLYAKTFFEQMNFDAVTVSPYMGKDTIMPFLEYNNKWVIVLAHTSNKGSADFQTLKDAEGNLLYEHVIQKVKSWTSDGNCMFVVGATHGEKLRSIRSLAPNHFFLVPGVGAQGGTIEEVSENGLSEQCGLLVNSSRSIIYAGDGVDFDKKAAQAAVKLQQKMSGYLKQ